MSVNERSYLIIGTTIDSDVMRELFGEDREQLDGIRIGYHDNVDPEDHGIKYIAGGMGDEEYLGRILAIHTSESPGFDFLDLSQLLSDTRGEFGRIRQALNDDFDIQCLPRLLLFTVYS